MVIKEVNNKEEWEEFFSKLAEKTFLQSYGWGEFNLSMGRQIWRFGVYENESILAAAMAVKVSSRRATYILVQHGPGIVEGLSVKDKKQILGLFIETLADLAKQEKASFLRIAPLFERNGENAALFADLGFREAPMHASAYEATWKLDIYPPEEELLKNMRKTTRYLIKKTSEDQDIEIIKSTDQKYIETYQKLNKEVSKRQHFAPFSDEHIKKEFEAFSKDSNILFLFGKYKKETVAGAMIIFWQGIGFYHQAASLGKYSKFSVPYLLQWEAIKEAKNRGCNVYDFWGFTDPEKFPNHPWAGPTLFKMGFGGYKKEYIKTQDFIISNKYWINYIIEKARKFKRGL